MAYIFTIEAKDETTFTICGILSSRSGDFYAKDIQQIKNKLIMLSLAHVHGVNCRDMHAQHLY